jgi:hypothetical protein
MAKDGCWGPMCEFTGSRTQSDATPGRCTGTGGYLAQAEINEIIKRGFGARNLYDAKSNTDIMIYNGMFMTCSYVHFHLLRDVADILGFKVIMSAT